MEDINANLYLIDCDVSYRKAWARKRGEIYPFSWKVPIGALCLLGIWLILWAPFVVFLTGSPLSVGNIVNRVQVTMAVQTSRGSYELFNVADIRTSANYTADQLTPMALHAMGMSRDDLANEYIQRFEMYADSNQAWQMTPPSFATLIRSLAAENAQLALQFNFDTSAGAIQISWSKPLTAAQTVALVSVLNGTASSLQVDDFYPLFWRLSATAPARPLPSLLVPCVVGRTAQQNVQWWTVVAANVPNATVAQTQMAIAPLAQAPDTQQAMHQLHTQHSQRSTASAFESFASASASSQPAEQGGLVFFTVFDKNFLGLLSSALYSYSIITLYFTFVFSIGRFLRLYVSTVVLVVVSHSWCVFRCLACQSELFTRRFLT